VVDERSFISADVERLHDWGWGGYYSSFTVIVIKIDFETDCRAPNDAIATTLGRTDIITSWPSNKSRRGDCRPRRIRRFKYPYNTTRIVYRLVSET